MRKMPCMTRSNFLDQRLNPVAPSMRSVVMRTISSDRCTLPTSR
jgi:hypothetical protein